MLKKRRIQSFFANRSSKIIIAIYSQHLSKSIFFKRKVYTTFKKNNLYQTP
eukprot:UN23980